MGSATELHQRAKDIATGIEHTVKIWNKGHDIPRWGTDRCSAASVVLAAVDRVISELDTSLKEYVPKQLVDDLRTDLAAAAAREHNPDDTFDVIMESLVSRLEEARTYLFSGSRPSE